MLIIFDDMIADMEVNKKIIPIVTELFIGGKRFCTSVAFYRNLISKCLKLNVMHFIMKISNKRELQQIAFNNLPYFQFKCFMKL